jgi:hypothetical protein
MKEVSFNAPWGAPLAVMTAVCAVMCLSLSVVGVMIGVGGSSALRTMGLYMIPPWIGWLLVAAPLLTMVASAAFMVRGYVLTDASLIIKRPGWERRLDLSRLISATADPDALERSFRIFGNGGFFSFTGWFRNKKLGVYRAFATDTKRAVVLRFSGKTVVITPDDPQKFVAEINSNKPMPPQS